MDARRTRWRAWACGLTLIGRMTLACGLTLIGRMTLACGLTLLCCGLMLVCGCTWDNPPPSYHSQPTAPKREEPPQVVQKPAASQPATDEKQTEEVTGSVLGWIRRVDDAQQRARERARFEPEAAQTYRQAADAEPVPATAPAGTPAVIIKPAAAAAPNQAELVGPAAEPKRDPTAEPATQPTATTAPVLAGVVVRPAPAAPAGGTVGPAAPGVNTPAAARNGPASLREFLAQTPAPADESFQQQVDERMLWAIAGDFDRAREPLKLVTAEQQELASRFVEAWIAIREGHQGDLAGAASAASRQLAELQEALGRLSELSIATLKICSAVRGYGQYDVLEPARFVAGNEAEMVLYCELRDFASEHRSDGLYYTTFDMTTTLLNRAGDNVLELKDAGLIDRCQNRRHDCFIPRLVRLPATLSPGQYVAKVTIVDKLAQKVAESCVSFQVVARP